MIESQIRNVGNLSGRRYRGPGIPIKQGRRTGGRSTENDITLLTPNIYEQGLEIKMPRHVLPGFFTLRKPFSGGDSRRAVHRLTFPTGAR
jgi:hypothetical protein